MMWAQYATYAMAVVLIAAIVIELRTGKIPNWLTLVPFVLFIAVATSVEDRVSLMWQLGFAVAVFGVGLLLFAFAGFGAGAVKLMSGLALFLPLSKIYWTLGLFIGSVFILAFILQQLRKAIADENSAWHALRTKGLPMSLPIGATGFLVMFVI